MRDDGVLVGLTCTGVHGELWLATAPGRESELVPTLLAAAPAAHRVDVMSEQTALTAALGAAGWVHAHSVFELDERLMAVPAPQPVWPDGVELHPVDLDRDAAAVHALVYERARWAGVPGRVARALPGWLGFFEHEGFDASLLLAAHRDGTPVGWANVRLLDSGAGYVQQLAVDEAERGRGLGRALLLEALHRLRDRGADRLSLTVYAANESALALYRSVGLAKVREQRVLSRP